MLHVHHPQVLKRRHDSLASTVPLSPSANSSEAVPQPDEKKARRETSQASACSPECTLETTSTCEGGFASRKNQALTFSQLRQYFTQFTGDLAPEHIQSQTKPRFLSKVAHTGTLQNKRVHVGISTRCSDSSLSSSNSASSSSGDEDEEEGSIFSTQESSTSITEVKPRSMLGLFSGDTFQRGECVTLYGGIRTWAGPGRGSIKERPTQFNTHVRRLPRSDFAMDGRPWSMLFPRIFSLADEATKVEPTVTPHSLINLLLLLRHEAVNHPVQKPTTDYVGSCSTIAEVTPSSTLCKRCVAERSNIIAQISAYRPTLQPIADVAASQQFQQEVQQMLRPSCNLCKTQVCMLPCEIDSLLLTWSNDDCVALGSLCIQVRNYISSTGLGYMANTDRDKAAWNVRVINTNPYVVPLSNIYPDTLMYIATRSIVPGEEIIVAYHNNDSKKTCTSPQKIKQRTAVSESNVAVAAVESKIAVAADIPSDDSEFTCDEPACRHPLHVGERMFWCHQCMSKNLCESCFYTEPVCSRMCPHSQTQWMFSVVVSPCSQ